MPGSPPPGGASYGTPPPRAGSNAGCLKAFGITCGLLLLLGIIGAVLLGRAVKSGLEHPGKGSIFGTIIRAGKAGGQGAFIQQAILRYHQKNGHYPDTLTDLMADGELDGKILHSDLDPNPNPGHISWRYVKPQEGAPGNTPILFMREDITIGNSRQPLNIVINLNGQSQSGAAPGG